jgi:hypothetical protein
VRTQTFSSSVPHLHCPVLAQIMGVVGQVNRQVVVTHVRK